MKNKILKLKLEFCAVAVVFFVVLVTCSFSFGWFSSNRKVDATGMSVSANMKNIGIQYRIQNKDGSWPSEWTGMPSGIIPGTDAIACPGDKNVMQIKVTNISLKDDVTISSIGFNEFKIGVEEKANAKGVFLGTQIYADLLYITNVDETNYDDVDVIEDTAEQVKIYDISSGPSKLALYNYTEGDEALEINEFFIYTIKLEFVDFAESQDDYKNFGAIVDGEPDGKCERTFYVDYE